MPDSVLHVLHVGPKQPGGIHSVLRELDARRDEFGCHGIAFSFFETRGFKRMRDRALFLLVDVPRFLAALSRRVDVVHFHVAVRGSFYRKYVLFALSRMLGRKTVIHMHSGEFDHFVRQSPGIGQAVVRHFVRGAHAAIGVSRATGAELATHGNRTGALYVIGNAAHAA
ncbi:glycosyltransferase, partial [Paraburkholderia sp. Se-20369]|nr:glycosyltransferase [Paraburkholderia sp. Se-20369]